MGMDADTDTDNFKIHFTIFHSKKEYSREQLLNPSEVIQHTTAFCHLLLETYSTTKAQHFTSLYKQFARDHENWHGNCFA